MMIRAIIQQNQNRCICSCQLVRGIRLMLNMILAQLEHKKTVCFCLGREKRRSYRKVVNRILRYKILKITEYLVALFYLLVDRIVFSNFYLNHRSRKDTQFGKQLRNYIGIVLEQKDTSILRRVNSKISRDSNTTQIPVFFPFQAQQ